MLSFLILPTRAGDHISRIGSRIFLSIVDLLIAKTQEALNSKEIKIELDKDAKQFLVKNGTDLKYGARPLRRAIQKLVEDEIAEMILRNEVTAGQTIRGYVEDDNLKFKI